MTAWNWTEAQEQASPTNLHDTKIFAITASTTGFLSFIASISTLWIIYRSHKNLSTTFNRLQFGLGIGDLMFSFAYMFSALPLPRDVDYMVWNARGNTASCSTQGFLLTLGWVLGSFYTCSIAFYYLAVIKYNKTDEYIRKTVEPLLHTFPIIISTASAVVALPTKGYNPQMVACCFTPYNPPHCEGVENGITLEGFDIPCGRGKGFRGGILMSCVGFFVLPLVIFVTMTIMYRAVLKNEKKLRKYGVGALRKNLNSRTGIQTEGNGNDEVVESQSIIKRLKTAIKRLSPCSREATTSKSNNASFHSRMVLYKAIALASAHFATYLFPMLYFIRAYFHNDDGGLLLGVLVRICFPLRGFFNFLVFIYPKVLFAKKANASLSWWQAFVKATTKRNLAANKANKAKVHKKKMPKESRKTEPAINVEEEKCEVEPPQSKLFSSKTSNIFASNNNEEVSSRRDIDALKEEMECCEENDRTVRLWSAPLSDSFPSNEGVDQCQRDTEDTNDEDIVAAEIRSHRISITRLLEEIQS